MNRFGEFAEFVLSTIEEHVDSLLVPNVQQQQARNQQQCDESERKVDDHQPDATRDDEDQH